MVLVASLRKLTKALPFVPLVYGVLVVVFPALVVLMNRQQDGISKLEVINVMAQIVVAASALLAFANYFERKSERNLKEIISLISFFREQVIPGQSKIVQIGKEKIAADFSPFRVRSFNHLDPESSYPESKSDFYKLSSSTNIKEIHAAQVELLNKLEQFSLTARLYSLEMTTELDSVRAAFIEIVECNIYVVCLNRVVGTSANLYRETLSLYGKWEPLVDKATPEERLVQMRHRLNASRK